MATSAYFTPATFGFLTELAANNSRDWFDAHKPRYEADVKEPALRLIADFGPHLKKISENFRADPRPVGGSLFRIHRDVRFSKDKSPYKTHTGIHFRHFASKDAHAPGFYLHIAPGEVFVGAGIWHPDAPTLAKIRERIVEDPDGWRRAVNGRAFRGRFELAGDSLVRPPKGFAPDHPLIEDLKRKDFIGVAALDETALTSPTFLRDFAALGRAGGALNAFLCGALGVGY
jgi:uncharacterized protein (TIGR02453 family)